MQLDQRQRIDQMIRNTESALAQVYVLNIGQNTMTEDVFAVFQGMIHEITCITRDVDNMTKEVA